MKHLHRHDHLSHTRVLRSAFDSWPSDTKYRSDNSVLEIFAVLQQTRAHYAIWFK
jgi:hypothetical protein